MFVAYHGPSQHFDPSIRRNVASYKARRQTRWAHLTPQHSPGTFAWRKIAESKRGRDQVRLLIEPGGEEAPPKQEAVGKTPQNKTRSRDIVVAPIATINIGGLRTDPFETYPIKARSYFPQVIDFYLQVISPNTSRDPFSIVLQNDLLFESIITLTLCMMPKSAVFPSMDLAVLQHHGGTVTKLNKRLSLPSPEDCASDAVILTVACLIATDVSQGTRISSSY
jgi:hypothetical protein